jgi:hypothetical protein
MLNATQKNQLTALGCDEATCAKLEKLGFSWTNLISIIQAVLAALGNLVPPAPPAA